MFGRVVMWFVAGLPATILSLVFVIYLLQAPLLVAAISVFVFLSVVVGYILDKSGALDD